MTLRAADTASIRWMEGPAYKVGPKCSRPGCGKFASQGHHIFPRSMKRGGPQDWVAIDGYVTGNVTGLCFDDHEKCHSGGKGGGHAAAIRWDDELREFWWCLYGGMNPNGSHNYTPAAPLVYQPPTPDSLTNEPATPDTPGPESCPFCGQARRRRSTPSRVGRRQRKSWSVLVPDDELERGADVLDDLIANLAPLVPNGDGSATGRYYVLVQALAFSLISAEEFAANVAGSNAA